MGIAHDGQMGRVAVHDDGLRGGGAAPTCCTFGPARCTFAPPCAIDMDLHWLLGPLREAALPVSMPGPPRTVPWEASLGTTQRKDTRPPPRRPEIGRAHV